MEGKQNDVRGRPIYDREWLAVVIMGVVILVLGLVVYRNWEVLASFQWQVQWGRLGISSIFHFLALNSLFLAWHLMISQLAGQRDWALNFRVYSLSTVARRIPLPIWYLGSRLYYYQKEKVPLTIILNASTLEASLIILSGAICYVLLLPWYTHIPKLPWWGFVVAIGVLIGSFAVRPSLLVDITNLVLRVMKRSIIPVTISQKQLLTWGLTYLATWFLDGVGLYYMVAALIKSPPEVMNVIGVSTLSAFVAIISLILPGGLGLKELTMGALLSYWVPLPVGVVISLLYRVLLTLLEIIWVGIGYLVYLRYSSAARPKREMELDYTKELLS